MPWVEGTFTFTMRVVSGPTAALTDLLEREEWSLPDHMSKVDLSVREIDQGLELELTFDDFTDDEDYLIEDESYPRDWAERRMERMFSRIEELAESAGCVVESPEIT